MKHIVTLSLVALAAACARDPHADHPDRVARRVTSADGDVGAVVEGNTAFALDLHRELAAAAGSDNLVHSPFSVSAALGMTSAGAGGETLAQLRDALHVSLDASTWHPAFGDLVDDLNGDKLRGYRLEVANRLFGQTGSAWADAFLATCADDWRAPLEEVDFGDASAAADRINGWVSDETQGHIDELLSAAQLQQTVLVLANAVYFKADWWTTFDKADTRDGTFTRLDGSTVEVPLMSLSLGSLEEHRAAIYQADGVSVARLPYEDDEVAAYVIVPDELDGLPALEASLDAAMLDAWADALIPAAGSDGYVVMPRFELRTKAELTPALQALGVVDAFVDGTADLSPMTGDANGLFLGFVQHEAWIKVDEEGTEAAAATASGVSLTSAPGEVLADHPFLFVVRDDLTGSVLFVARVTDPS